MKKIRFGFVGTNFVSDWMAEEAAPDLRFEATAIYSRHEDTGRTFADKHGIPHVFTSLEEMASSDLIDAAYIASPNFLHAEQSELFMNNGKHVFCEKPMASNVREVERMITAARRNNVVLMEAMIPTLSPNFEAVMKNLHRVGRIRRYFASYCQYSSRYDNLKRGIVANAFRPEMSNGAIMDIGVYCIYPMVALFGKPQQILSSTMRLSTGADSQGSLIATYDGFDAVIMYSKIADSMLPTEIQGEEGTLTIDRINSPKKVTFTPHDKSLPAEDLTVDASGSPYYYEMKEFIDLVTASDADGNGYRARESSKNSLKNSLATISIIDEIRLASGIRFPADS